MDDSKHRQQHEQLREFLTGANVAHHLDALITRLKVHSIAQLKYVKDDDLLDIGMSKPEVHHLMKLYRKQTSQPGTFSKLRKKLLKSSEDDTDIARSPTRPVRRSRPTSMSMREDVIRRPAHNRSGLHAGLISAPQNDLRHTLHVGYDGAVFGDMSLIGGTDRLPTTAEMPAALSECDDMSASLMSLPISSRPQTVIGSVSDISTFTTDTLSYGGSIISSDTLTDVSSLHENDSIASDIDDDDDVSQRTRMPTTDDCTTPDADNFSDLTIPDFASFDLGPSLVDEVMKAFGTSTITDVADNKSPAKSKSCENSVPTKVAEDLVPSKDLGPPLASTALSKSHVVGSSYSLEAPAVAEGSSRSDDDGSETESGPRHDETLTSEEVSLPTSDKSPSCLEADEPVALRDCCSSPGESDVSFLPAIWQLRQPASAGHSPPIIHRKTGSNTLSPLAPAKTDLAKTTSLSPRAITGHVGLKTLKSPSTGLSSSSEKIQSGISSRVAASLVAKSSSSLPARSSLYQEPSTKLPHHTSSSGMKANSGDSSDSDSSNILHRLKGKASFSRFSGFRSSGDTRAAKSELPLQNLNVNVHFFDRLREQEMQGAWSDETDTDKSCLTPGDRKSGSAPSSSLGHRRNSPSLRLDMDTSRCDRVPRVQSMAEDHSRSVAAFRSTVTGLDGRRMSPIASPHDEVARLSCRSTESHDSSSHDSELSSNTQPSDEGVYSDDSVAASADDIKLRPQAASSLADASASAAGLSSERLGISDRHDAFWSCHVDFRELTKFGHSPAENWSLVTTASGSGAEQSSAELQLMHAVVSDVSSEECLYTLSETDWNVATAIKLLLLRRILSITNEDLTLCKEALMSSDWDLGRAAWRLNSGRRPKDPDSPEIVHV